MFNDGLVFINLGPTRRAHMLPEMFASVPVQVLNIYVIGDHVHVYMVLTVHASTPRHLCDSQTCLS